MYYSRALLKEKKNKWKLCNSSLIVVLLNSSDMFQWCLIPLYIFTLAGARYIVQFTLFLPLQVVDQIMFTPLGQIHYFNIWMHMQRRCKHQILKLPRNLLQGIFVYNIWNSVNKESCSTFNHVSGQHITNVMLARDAFIIICRFPV